MASGRSIASRRRTRAKAAWTRSTSSRSSVSGRAISWGVWAQAKAPTSIRPSGRHTPEHLVAQRVGRRPREGRLLLAHDGLRRRALAQQLLEAVQQVVALGLRDVEQRDDLAVEARRPRRRLAGHGHGVGGVEILGHRILLITRLLPFENVQPGTTAENRPAVPPATRILMCCGARNFGIGVASCSA